jgi:acyl transferase domain-containing protein
VCFTAATGRAPFEHRLAVVGGSVAQVRARLEAVASGRETEGVVSGRAGPAPKVAFLFGDSEPYAGMGRQLYESQPVFREALEKCGEALKGVLEKPLLEVLYGAEGALLKEAAYGNAAVFAVEWALARLWRAWGVKPRRVEGHGAGEDVAGVEAGAFGLEEGLKRAVARGPRSARADAEQTLKADGAEVCLEVVPPRPGRSEWTQVLETLGGLYVRGVEVDWAGYDAPYGRRRVVLPTYPFQRQRYWLTRERLTPAAR